MEKRSLAKLALAGMVVGGFALIGCDDSTSSKADKTTGIVAAKTLADFEKECKAANGTFSKHSCEGMNSCVGHSYIEGKGVASHSCEGMSSCEGGSCIEKT